MIILFTGPSMPPASVPPGADLEVRPPAGQGDVYRAARERPWGIGVVDGYFERVPSIWHKEILWAMSEGVHVFGAASMGALRAAELAAFGMVGVGEVFARICAGEITDDDEVAVAHARAEHGYRSLSEAQVNIRATLAAAVTAGRCSGAVAQRLVSAGKQMFYAERTWPALFAEGRRSGLTSLEIEALERWLPEGRVDQKRRDAQRMVEVMLAHRAKHPRPLEVGFHFEHTNLWDQAAERMRRDDGEEREAGGDEELLQELRLEGDESRYDLAINGALVRSYAEELASRGALTPDSGLIRHTAALYRRERGLLTAERTEAWLEREGVVGEEFYALIVREAKLRWAVGVSKADIRRHLVDQLRAMGFYGRLRARAAAKRAASERLSVDTLRLADVGLDDAAALWRWYFVERLGVGIPEDISTYAERLGFANEGDLFDAALRERWFSRVEPEEAVALDDPAVRRGAVRRD